MVIGAAIVAVSLLILGFTREFVGLLIQEDEAARRPTIVLAVLSIYVLDFAINARESRPICPYPSRQISCPCLVLTRDKSCHARGVSL
jgi:hypothetical protein